MYSGEKGREKMKIMLSESVSCLKGVFKHRFRDIYLPHIYNTKKEIICIDCVRDTRKVKLCYRKKSFRFDKVYDEGLCVN